MGAKNGTFQGWLQDRLASVDLSTVKSPPLKLKRGDVVIGKADDDDFKRLCEVRAAFTVETNSFATRIAEAQEQRHAGEKERDENHDPETCESCGEDARAAEMQSRHTALESLFWAEVRARLDDKGSRYLTHSQSAIGVTENWEIIASPQRMPRVQVIELGSIGIPAGLAEMLAGMRN